MNKYIPNADTVLYLIQRRLDDIFCKIPLTEIEYNDDTKFSIRINMSPSDYSICLLSGNTIKKWIKEEFDVSDYKISVTKFKHPRLTLNYTEYSIIFTKIQEEV